MRVVSLGFRRVVFARSAVCVGALAMPCSVMAQNVPLPLIESTTKELHASMKSGHLTAEGLAARYLARVGAHDRTGADLRAILALNPALLAEARQRDRDAHRTGRRGPLFGIPVLLKDNIDALPMATTAGAEALAGSMPPDDSFLARRLRAAGAVIFGKATLTEFANFMSGTGMPNGYSALGSWGANPYDPRRRSNGSSIVNTGGSSSGSAIATAANFVSLAIGTETSGSILSPSSANGVVGIKPTVGLVSRDGILPITADQDTAGPIARTVEDAARLLGAIAGYDPADPATAPCQTAGNCYSDYTQFLDRASLQGARIAYPRPWFFLSISRQQIMRAAVGTMRAAGAFVVDPHPMPRPNLRNISISPPPSTGQSTVLIFGMKRDLNSYLANLGPTAPRQSLAQIIAYNNANQSTALLYGQSILTAADRYDTTPNSPDHVRYVADRRRDLADSRAALDAVLNGPDGIPRTPDDFDAIVFPSNYGADAPARAGYPSVIVPGGLDSSGLPFGVTFTGRAFSESRLLALAYAFEQATGHRTPPASTPAVPTDNIPLNLATVDTLGTGCPGSNGTPTITTGGPPIVANSAFTITLGSTRPNAPTLLGVSPSGATTSIGPCHVYLVMPFAISVVGTSDANGDTVFSAGIPWIPALSGVKVLVQGGVVDPGANAYGIATSGALRISIGG